MIYRTLLLLTLFLFPSFIIGKDVNNVENINSDYLKKRNSIWVQAGLGLSYAQVENKLKRDQLYYFNGGLHFIPNQFKYAVGACTMGEEWLTINSIWATAGYNMYSPNIDISFNAGFSMTNYRKVYEFIGNNTSKTVDYRPGILLNIQTLVHMPYVLGLGFELTGNYNNNASYIVLDFILALGYFR